LLSFYYSDRTGNVFIAANLRKGNYNNITSNFNSLLALMDLLQVAWELFFETEKAVGSTQILDNTCNGSRYFLLKYFPLIEFETVACA